MMKKHGLFLTLLLLSFSPLRADEGMWIPSLIGNTRLAEMQARGLELTASDLYDVNQASLKDAVVRFGNGCTGELISHAGLLLTNHHCGYGQIQAHSSVQNDLLTHGFWARSLREELPNPGLTVTFLVRMEDVTADALRGVRETMDESERSRVIAENTLRITGKATDRTHYTAAVVPFYYGNQYFLFVYETFEDVRLVAAPPSSVGSFGGDTDNWMWPRHTGDFSLFRIYAGADNKPAPYSPDNVPYMPKKWLTISLGGVEEGDFTFIYGNPARTTEYLLSDAVDYLVLKGNPAKIALRTLRLQIMSEEQAKDPATRIRYASKHASVGNQWKKMQGESKGLLRLRVADEKRQLEERFIRWAADKPPYAAVVPGLKALYTELDEYAFARDYYLEAFHGTSSYAAVEIAGLVRAIRPAVREGLIDESQRLHFMGVAADYFKNYSLTIDRRTSAALLRKYYEDVPEKFRPPILDEYVEKYGSVEAGVADLFDRSRFTSAERVEELLSLPAEEVRAALETDPAARLEKSFREMYGTLVEPHYNRLSVEIDPLCRLWMRGLMEMETDRTFYPDATFTLRIAYGEVAGYKAADAVYYFPVSTIEGIMEKDDPEVYDYNIPQQLRDIYAARDYGRWEVDGTIPVCFLATNHTTGGNSGSPVLNKRGELIGVNFDRTWESTMSDVKYDPSVCRNISVDIRYVLFIIDRIGRASYLFNEMWFAE